MGATVALGVAAMLGGSACGASSATSSGEPSPVPTADVAGASLGCVDAAGTVSADAAQWYLADGRAAIQFGNQPADGTAIDFIGIVMAAVDARLAEFGVQLGDAGWEASVADGCVTSRWVDLWDSSSHSYFVSLWRPETRADLTSRFPDTAFHAAGERLILGDRQHDARLQDGVVVVAVGSDGTTLAIGTYGKDLPSTADLADVAMAVLRDVLAARPSTG